MSGVEASVVLQPVGSLVVVPLRGPVNHDLLTELSDKLLDHLQHSGTRGVILDMSGVDLLDDQDFDDLSRVARSASLMGVPVIFAGIRPGVAIGLTLLNVEDDWVRATRTVELAVEELA